MAGVPVKGDRVPEFELQDSTGEKRTLSEFLKKGKVALVFLRGLW